MKQLLISALLILCLNAKAQVVPIGDWQIHAPYNVGLSIIETENEIYFCGQYGIFKMDQTSNETDKISKVNGLSDNGFSTLGYHTKTNAVIIGYQNGNLDIIKGNEIINISSIKKAQNILGSKRINDIQEYGDFVFVSTDFGVVKVDIVKESIKETYKNITVEGDVLKVNESIIVNKTDNITENDSIFLATDIGIMSANLNSTNLIDYNQWLLYDSTNNVSEEECTNLIEYQGSIYGISKAKGEDRANDLFIKKKDLWTRLPLAYNPFFPWLIINNIFIYKDELHLSYDEAYYKIDATGKLLNTIDDGLFIRPNFLFEDKKGVSYTADLIAGFYKLKSEWSYFTPNGPYFANIFNLQFINNTIYGMSGGYYSNSLQPELSSRGYYTYTNNKWSSISNQWPTAKDFVDVAKHDNRNEIYFASYGHGLVMLDSDNEYHLFSDSTLVTTASTPFISPLTKSFPRARVAAVETDKEGRVWFSNYLSYGNASLFKINDDGTWDVFDLNHASADYINQIIFDDDNNAWALANGSVTNNGIFTITQEGKKDRFINETELPSKPSFLANDKTGNIWVGTNTGIVIFNDPNDLQSYEMSRPIVDGRYLLEEEVITCIEVDGANRKWIGTTNGLWLVNADGTEQINYFNVDNSPLLSNRIQTLKLHPETGELFIGTDFGIISYRTPSTEGSAECADEIVVFPNPVTPNFTGYVGINGTAENAIVKITDVSGKLVYETNAFGGQAVWNVQDLNGNPAKTGIYLTYISTEDGESTCVTKVAVVE